MPDLTVFGVRFTDESGATVVHATKAPETAPVLAASLRKIQSDRAQIADAHVVTRRMRGDTPRGEWVAFGPASIAAKPRVDE